jgi:glycosyltransferase involved in cell wall biosynthesis
VSEGVAASFAAGTGLPTESVNVIYNPVLTEQYWRAIERTPEHPWFAPGELPVIMGVGRLVAQKDFPNLIWAFAEVRSRIDARLMILGEGPDRAKLEQLVTELELGEWVSLPGFVKDPVSLMARAATFALSSVREGLPTVLIEALATGVPVVSTDCESGPREILRGGELGRLVPVGDSAALAEAITAALSEPARKVDPVHLQEYFPKESARKYLQAAGIDA